MNDKRASDIRSPFAFVIHKRINLIILQQVLHIQVLQLQADA